MKWFFRVLLLIALVAGALLIYDQTQTIPIPEIKVPVKLAPEYLEVSQSSGIPWPYLAAWDEVEREYQGVNRNTLQQRVKKIRRATETDRPSEYQIREVIRKEMSEKKAEQILQLATSYDWAAAPLGESYQFPFAENAEISYGDTWGASRSYGGERPHEGTDLMAKKGTPIHSVGDGRVVSKGWNQLGGWRLTILDTDHPQISFYYAHLSKYADGIETGSQVKKGQVIGYVGDSGYGPEGTTGQFAPHLHLGIYVRESTFSPKRETINPYLFLKVWEEK